MLALKGVEGDSCLLLQLCKKQDFRTRTDYEQTFEIVTCNRVIQTCYTHVKCEVGRAYISYTENKDRKLRATRDGSGQIKKNPRWCL